MPPFLSRVAVVVALLGTGCAHDDDDDGTAYAEVECAHMTDHMIEVLVREGATSRRPADLDLARGRMVAQREALIAGCEKDRPTRRLTRRQYACLLDADTTEAMSHCQ